MNKNATPLSSWLVRAGQIALLVATAGCAQPAPTTAVAVPPVPAGEGRIWVYRNYEPYTGKGLPAVGVNGGIVGVAELGGAFYRNVPPGHYSVSVESTGRDFNQVASLDVSPGQETYVRIVSNPEWVSGGDTFTYERPTFYAWQVSPDAGRADVARLSFYGGS
jgi:hypothetical protein